MTVLIALLAASSRSACRFTPYTTVKMTLSWSVRVVRGGSAVQTVYWRASQSSTAPKLVKHGRVLNFKQTTPPPPLVHQKLSTNSRNAMQAL